MKKAIIILCLAGFVAGVITYQKYNQQRLSQAIGGWQSKVDMAQLNGKSPDEVSAFLIRYGASQEPYTGLKLVHDRNTSYREGYILAHTRPVVYLLRLPEPRYYSVQMNFTFDEQNKCTSSYVWSQGS